MDFSKFKTSDWLKVGGAIVAFFGYFFDWTSVDCPNIPGIGSVCANANLSGSSFFFRGTLPWLLVLATGVLTALLVFEVVKKTVLPWSIVFLAATGLATLLVLIYIIHPSYQGFTGIGRGIGAWLAFFGSAAAFAGSFIGFTEGGGDLNDLKDINKLKAEFGIKGDSAGTPPPPPPGMTPPPPPPPPPGSMPPPPPPA